jgi:hypothetical protein
MFTGSVKKYWHFIVTLRASWQGPLVTMQNFQNQNKSSKTPLKIPLILEEMIHPWQVVEKQVEVH